MLPSTALWWQNAQSVLAWALWVKITCFFSLPVLFMVMGFSI